MSDISKKIPGENEPLPPKADPAEDQRVILGLLSGAIEDSTEAMVYFADRIKALSNEGSELERVIAELDKRRRQMVARLSAVQCQVDGYQEDLLAWHRKPVKLEAVK